MVGSAGDDGKGGRDSACERSQNCFSGSSIRAKASYS